MSIFVVDGLYDKSIKKTMYEENLYFRAERIKTRNAHAHLVYKTIYSITAKINAEGNTIILLNYDHEVKIITNNYYTFKLDVEGLDPKKFIRKAKKGDVFATVALIDTVLRTSKYLGINNIDISYLKESKNRELLEIIEKALKVFFEIYKVNIFY